MRCLALFVAAIAACGGKPGGSATTPRPSGEGMMHTDDSTALGQPCAGRMLAMPESDESTFGPLEVGADYARYSKVSKEPFPSKTHGGRFVEVYVNDKGYDAYTKDQDYPVGTVIVKTSWENEGGKPSTTAGPIFVMRKEAAGYSPDHDDWYYAIHWEKPTQAQLGFLKGPIYWRGKSPKVEYCWKCHDNYDKSIGGVPPAKRAYGTP
jgi:hypothetical protein